MPVNKRVVALVGAGVLAAAGALLPSPEGTTLIKTFEGRRNAAYLDPVGIATICYGSIEGVQLGQRKTDAECEALLQEDLAPHVAAVRRLVRVPITQSQFDALVSFSFNLGTKNLENSTLLRKANAGQCRAAGAEFLRWDKAKGRVLPGLTRRRAAERAFWDKGCAAWGQ